MEWIFPTLAVILGASSAWLGFRVAALRARNVELERHGANTGAQAAERMQQIELLVRERDAARSGMQQLQERIMRLEAGNTELKVRREEEQRLHEEKLKVLNQASQQLNVQFEHLANRIFEEKTQKFTTQNRENLDRLLSPLKEQLGDFRKRVDDVYDRESKDRVALHQEISHLRELNHSIGEEALNLTRALKGDSKARGTWGEVVLERVLEASGLEAGREYDLQVSLQNADGRRYQPDVIVHLPSARDVIIDSKVSLNAYERFSSAADGDEREQALREHLGSLRTHVRELSGKRYDELQGVRSLDFVLMFVPVEAAFVAAVRHDQGLFGEALEKNIVIVSPSTLLVTLRTIQNSWRTEDQNRNALEIAEQAGRLYDQMVLYVEALDEVGRQLHKAGEAYDTAQKRLHTGRGNVIKRMDDLRRLGVKARKELPASLVEDAREEISSEVSEK